MAGRSKRGIVLIITLLSIGVLFFFLLLFVRLHVQERSLASRGENDLIAEQSARAGIDDSLFRLKKDSGWTDGFNKVSLPHSHATYSVSFDRRRLRGEAIPYSTNNATGAATATGYDGRTVPAGSVHIISVGIFENARKIEEAMINTRSDSLFSDAIFVSEEIEIKGQVKVDSYDSSKGAYKDSHMDSGADIGTNSAEQAAVTLTGQASVMGKIQLPTGADAGSSIRCTSGAYYESSYTAPVQEISFMEPPASPGPNRGDVQVRGGTATLQPGVYNNISISSGANVVFQAGEYVINGNLDVSGNSNVTTGGSQVKVYMMGPEVLVAGNANINPDGAPANFLIMAGPDTVNIRIQSGGASYAAVYAPAASVQISGNGDLYGAITAKEVKISGSPKSGFHFDQSLKNIPGPPGVTVTARW